MSIVNDSLLNALPSARQKFKMLNLEGEIIMIPKIKHVLYATDLSKNSAYAFRYAVNTAEKHDAKITIIYVLADPRFVEFPVDMSQIYEGEKPSLGKKLRARLEEFIKKELKDKPEFRDRIASMEILEGDPATAILQKAEDSKSDVLIMGTHGKGIIAHAFLGSVASQVLQRIRIPVFTIPIPKKTDIVFNS